MTNPDSASNCRKCGSRLTRTSSPAKRRTTRTAISVAAAALLASAFVAVGAMGFFSDLTSTTVASVSDSSAPREGAAQTAIAQAAVTTTSSAAPSSTEEPAATTNLPAATTSTSINPTTTTIPLPRPTSPTLGPAGLGVADFGQNAGTAFETLSASFGLPDEDSGWVGSFSEFGTCPGEQARQVQWSNLAVIFVSSEEGWPDWDVAAGQTLWGASIRLPTDGGGISLTTAEGIEVGSTVAGLQEAYPGISVELDDWLSGVTGETHYFFTTEDGIRGHTTGPLDSDVVEALRAGGECGE